jgi:hypothetical protein
VSAAAAAALEAAGSSEEPGPPLAPPAATPPAPPSETRPAPATPGRDPVWRRALRAPVRHRRWSIAVLAVVVALIGFAGWRVLGGGDASSTIPSSFDGKWVGTGPTYDTTEATFEVVLDEGLRIAQMSSGASSCYGGALRVTEATDAKLTTRFTSVNPECSKWGVVFTHADGTDDQLVMSVDPDGNTYNPFEIKLDRQN